MADMVVVEHGTGADPLAVRMRRVAVRTGLVVLGLAVVAGLLVLRQMFSHLWPSAWMVDFAVYYHGGLVAVHGGVSLYDLSVDTNLFTGLPFTYPPFSALVFGPLTLMSMGVASLVWSVLSVACLAGVVWLSLRMVGFVPTARRLAWTAAGTVAAVALDPVLQNLLIGQINIIITFLVLLDLSDLLPKRWRGFALGIAAGLKLIPLIFVVYLLVSGRRAVAARAGGTFLGTIALGFVLMPHDSVRYWLKGVFLKSGRTLHSIVVNHSLPGFFARSAGTDVAPGWSWPITVLVGVLGVVLAVWVHRRGQEMVAILTVAATSMVVSPITWPMHGIWAVPVLVWLAFAAWRRAVVLPKVLLVLVALSFVVPLYEYAQGFDRYQDTLPGNLIATFGGLLVKNVLWLVTVPWWLRHLRTTTPPEPVAPLPG
jgi:alpha-1,2-mannosyltransferase